MLLTITTTHQPATDLGYLLYNSVQNTDYPLMQALFMLFTVAVLVAVLVCDIAIAFLDPRSRERDRSGR